ncbi:MAG: T9SS type A sorting domain-containing protein [Calditrichaeota bacterium]|nr:T9SS type A sorting domain-containing protein [Calditrichota bacterium]
MRRVLFILSLAAVALFGCIADLFADITVAPLGIAVAPEAGDEVAEQLTIANRGQEVAFTLHLQQRNLGIGNQAPRRDLRGGPDRMEYSWRDNQEGDGPRYQWVDIRNRQGVVNIPNLVDDAYYGMFDLGFVFPYYGREYRQIGVHSNGFATFIPAREIVFYWPQWERLPNANPGAADQTPPPTCLAVNYQDLNPAVHGNIYYWTDEQMAVVTWFEIPHFANNEAPHWTFQLILTADGLIKYQYSMIGRYDNETNMVGLQNEERNLGFTVIWHDFEYLQEERCIAFGPPDAWIDWVDLEPRGGRIAGGEAVEIDVNFRTEDLEDGYYWADVILTTDARDRIILPLLMSLDSPVGSISGQLVDAADDAPLAGGMIELQPVGMKVFTDDQGRFTFENIPPRAWTIVGSFGDYFPAEEDIEVAAGEETEVNFALMHAECNPQPERITAQIAPGNETHIDLTISNDGNAPLTYRITRRLPDIDVNPWELRRSYNVGQTLNDDRIEGAAFGNDSFFVAGAAGQNPNTIYVLNREGEFARQFDQPGQSQYGMKDLEWDGEWLWGSGERRVFGFTPDGQVQVEFEGPYNPNNAIAWDCDNGILWVATSTNNLVAFDRDGNRTGAVLNRRGLRISGLAYWSDDSDGYPIYIQHNPEQGFVGITKMNNRGDTLAVRTIEIAGGSSGGAYITNQFDIYSWVFISIANIPRNAGNDRIDVYQLASNFEWFSITPANGVIAAGEEQEFDVLLNAAGLPEERFFSEFVIEHDGLGKLTYIPVTLDVVMGPFRTIRTIQMARGWNLVSINLQPDEEDVRVLTRPLVEAGLLQIMKDGEGRFYLPLRNFNNIPGWFVPQGYLMKVNTACSLDLQGITVMADDPLQLREGWNMAAYYPRFPTPADAALAGIADHLIIAKDGFGGFYAPAYRFNNMAPMCESRGYQLKVDRDIELVYRIARGAAGAIAPVSQALTHWSYPAPTGGNMSILALADGLNDGEAAIFVDNRLVGAGLIVNGRAGLAVWGDDPTTAELDGAVEGDEMILRLWNGKQEQAVDIQSLQSSSLIYTADGFEVIKLDISPILPDEFGLDVYPNPFNTRLTLRYALPEAGPVEIQILDIAGRVITAQSLPVQTAGTHNWILKADNLASGIYYANVMHSNTSITRKAVLLK